jgi:hypothetical protein
VHVQVELVSQQLPGGARGHETEAAQEVDVFVGEGDEIGLLSVVGNESDCGGLVGHNEEKL